MDDLISRAAALEALGECPYNWNDWPEEIQAVDDWESHKEAIENIPAVDAVPVVHSRWDEIRDYSQAGLISFECSECGRLCDTLYKYCPHCGAKMDGDENAAD